MSVYSVKGRGWRYDFTHRGTRHTEAWFKTKNEAKMAEAKRKEELLNPQMVTKTEAQNPVVTQAQTTQTGIAFLELVNRRLDHVKAYNSEQHYEKHVYMARRWIKKWGKLQCKQVTQDMIQRHILERKKVSAYTANKEIRYLRATYNFGIKHGLVDKNPLGGIDFLPVEKKIKYVPSPVDIDKVIALADTDTQDYLWTIRDTMGRISEINRLTWEDVNVEERYVVLYTRKKSGGNLTPRKVPMTQKLYDILSRRYQARDKSKPWVFWHSYYDVKTQTVKTGPYKDRKGQILGLCRRAGVRRFGFHALRHAGASVMDHNQVPLGAIQRILGHENRTTTEIYLHSMGNVEREAMAIYEQARQKSHTESHTDLTAEKEKGASHDS